MATEREIQKLRDMLKRKYYAGMFLGFALASSLAAGGLHALADPNIANSVVEYSVERQALHSTLISFRNTAVGSAIITFIISMFLDQSTSDIAR